MFLVLLALALIFDFLNGMHDSSNIVATVISSRAARPRVALLLAATAHFLGPFLFGVAVATTIGDDLLVSEAITQTVVVAALAAAIIWNLLTWYFGIPSSSSHALLGGLLGAAIIAAGGAAVQVDGLLKIVLALLLSPPLGLLTAFLIMRVTLWASRNSTPNVNTGFRRMQIPTLIALALSHGTNDAQKTMGVIALGCTDLGDIRQRDRNRARNGARRVAANPHTWGQDLQGAADTRIYFADCGSGSNPGRFGVGRPSEHNPGHELGHRGRRCRRKSK
jgi:PiT family inorganic phosphate transporter